MHISLGATFFIGAALSLAVFAMQHRGILETARVQLIMGLLVIVPMLIVGTVPCLNGKVSWATFSPFVPLATPYAPAPSGDKPLTMTVLTTPAASRAGTPKTM